LYSETLFSFFFVQLISVVVSSFLLDMLSIFQTSSTATIVVHCRFCCISPPRHTNFLTVLLDANNVIFSPLILASHLRVASCLLLPAIQLVVGISHPSWASLPFFVGSCVGLVDWSLTSNFLGLFRWFYMDVSFMLIHYLFRCYLTPFFLWAYVCVYGSKGGGGFFSCMRVLIFSCFTYINFLWNIQVWFIGRLT
jgi:hypothetical protein